jgi:ethanolamine utilization microcompartment shell protein EutL
VLKKAAIIVAGSAAAILAAAPLALAHGTDHSPTCKSAKQSVGNYNPQTASGVSSPLLGLIGVAANAAAPVSTQAQAPVASCNNIEDILNTKVSDNFQDNSKTITKIDRSGNN